jgi:predicted aspartyl protease
MEFDYSTYRNREGTFYRPSIDLTFKYKSASFPYKSALVDTGSDFILIPLSLAEVLGEE